MTAGKPALRVEDKHFITRAGRYVGDITLARQRDAKLALSPYAHARIAAIDTSDARIVPEFKRSWPVTTLEPTD